MFRLPVALAAVALGGLLLIVNAPVSVEAGGAKKPKGRLPNGWKQLGLSREQIEKIYTIQSSYEEKIDALEKQIEKLREDSRFEIYNVLTDGQRELLRQLIAKKSGVVDAPPDKVDPKKPKKSS